MDTSDLAGMADYQLIGDAFGYHSGYGSASGQPTGQSGQPQPTGLPVTATNMPPSAVLSGLSAQGSAQAYHQLQSQHSRAAYPQNNDPLMSHKIHSQYPNYGSGGSGVQSLGVRGQYPTPDPRYVQHGMADYNSAMSQSHLSLQSGGPNQPSMTSAYGQQNLIGQYSAQRMHSPGITPSRQPTGPMHGMPSHYSASYPSAPTQGGYHSHSNPSSDIWSSQGVPHMQQSSTYPGYPGSGPSGPSSLSSQGVSHSPTVSMHGPRSGQSQYVSHSEYSSSAMHSQDAQRQYYPSTQGPTQTQSLTAHIPTDGSTLPYPTPPQGPYSGTSGSQVPQPTQTRGPHSSISGSVPRQQYMSYNTSTLQSQPPSQQVSQTQPQSSGVSIPRYPQQYPGYQQPSSYGDTSSQSRLSPYPLSQTGPTGPNSPQFRPGYPSSTGSQLSSLSPRRPTTTPPAGSPMPPSSHTPDRSANTSSSQASTHQSSFPISPGANHLSSPVQGMSPGSSVPSTPSSLQQLEQMVLPHLGGVTNNSKSSIPVSTNSTSSSSSTSSYYGSVAPNTPSAGGAPPSPQPPNAGQRQTQNMYSHYPTPGNMPSNQSQYQYHQYQQNSSHWSGPQPNQITPVAVSSSSTATSITNTHSMGGVSGGIPLQPQSSLPSIGQPSSQSSNTSVQHQNSPTVASNSSSPNVSKPDVSIPANNSISGQYNSYSSELNTVSATDSNFSQSFVSRSTTSSTNSTPSSSSSSSQPLQSGYNVSQSTGTNSASFDSPVIKAQHKQQTQAAQNDTQQSQSQSQAAVAQMASPTHMFDSIKSPNAGTPRPLTDPLSSDLQQQQQQSNQQSERIPNSQSVSAPQPPLIPGVPHQSHHPYHQMMHQQQVHQPYPTQPQIPNYQNSYDPSGLNYDMNAVAGDMSQSSGMNTTPYGDHDSMMYDSYGMDSMVPPPMGDYHRDSAGDFGPLDPYSANFDDSYGEPPTKRKGKGRPKKDPNEPKKERKPRQPRAPRGSGRGRGRGNKNNINDRMAPMPPSGMIPPEYGPNYGMQSDNIDMYSHEMYGQHIPPQSAISQQQTQSIPPMSLNAPPPPQQQPPPPPPPPPPAQSPPPQQQQQTNHSQQQLQTQQQMPSLQTQSQNDTPITSPVPSVPPHSGRYTPPLVEQPIPPIIEKPIEDQQNLYEENFLEQTTISDNNNLNETSLISMPTDEEPNMSVAVPAEGDIYSPPRQVSPSPPPVTDDVIPEPKIDSYEFADEQTLTSTPVKVQKQKKAKKRKPKREETEAEVDIDSETKPPKTKKTKKRKKVKNDFEELKEIQSEEADNSLKTLQTDLDDVTQESSQCESSAIESSTGKSSKKEKNSKRESKPKKPKIKNKSPKKKLPKLALKFSKNKKRRRLGSPDHSDLERTPPPSPDDTETGIQKRRSARNTKRHKYTDDIELELSEDDDKLDGKKLDSSGVLTPLLNSDGKPFGDGQVLSVVTNINEDTMAVEKIMSSRLAQREIEDENAENNELDPNFKAQTIEVEEYFVKYKNLSYFHCEWKTEEELEKGDRRIAQKIKRFKQKKDTMNMFDFLDEEPYNPDYIEVDRILDVNEIEEIIEVLPEITENKEIVENKLIDETESQNSQTETDDKTETNSADSSIVPNERNESEKTDTKSSETIDSKDKSEESAEKPNIEQTSEEDLTKQIIETGRQDDKNETNDEIEDKNESEVIEEKEEENEKTSDEQQVNEVPVKTRKVKHYLVKWRALAYEDSTWELEDDLDPIKVEQFWKFRKPPPKNEWKPKRRPKPADWKKIDDSPVYKAENTLREYQLEGLNWLSFCWYNGQNCILADEMGLGKTIQSIAFVNEICIYGIPGPFLIIAPLSTIGNWQREFETWTDLNVITYHGSSASRNMLQEYEMYYKNEKNERIAGIYKFQVMITTFEIVLTDCLELREIHWRTCIIDEAHRLKNRNCKLLEGLRLLDMEHRVLLTGTPLQNNVEELFSLLNFLEPTQFTSNESFMLEFGDLKTEAQVDKLKAILKPMMLRRLKEDVEKSLAPKEETIVEVELTNVQKKYYRAILERNFQFLSKGGTYANMPNLMNTMMELRKCCIHPFLINGAEEQIIMEFRHQHGGDNEPIVNAIVQASGKLVLIDKLLPRLRANGHRVLIFSQMVRCLDILEDYMVQKRYPYERIDGRVRGNLRQAAIDRFCKPDSDRFVFLLCTRAGGLGINLTAADTVIIFDSDWNPQNDLQAQARCHRIGQSKAVKVYRLICRNTYEREMFDKASLKLGLDRAVLQSLNTQKANLVDNQLSKKEIEDLLRKGAYGALMEDDNAGDKFCEEDIEQILQRRTTKIIIESEGKGSTFSKASFASSSNRSDIEIDDPNFWEKWAKKANFDVDELKGRNELIVQEPRRRTQTKRFGADDAVLDMSELETSDEDDDSVSMRTRGGRNRLPKGKKGKKGRGGGYERERDEDYLQEFGPGNWTRAECYKVEKGLLTFGWGRWAECLILGNFRRHLTRLDVENISRVLLLFALQNYKGDEKIKAFIWDLISPNEDGEHRIHRNHSGLSAPVPRGRKNKKMKKTVGEELESADWAKDDKFNPDVLLTDDMYRKHLHRHANKILLRVRLLYYLKHEIIGDLHEQVFAGITARDIPIPPPVADGDPPASWWDEDADKSLLVGVYKHGYDRFNLMRQDAALCFLQRCGPPDGAALLAELNADDDLGKTLEEDDEPETPATPATPLSEGDCTKSKSEKCDSVAKEEPEVNEQSGAFLPFPSAADMNHRLRRVVTSYQRNFKKQEMKLAQRARHQQRLERLERFEAAIKERELKKREQAQKKWSRREEADFYRVVSSFGVEYKRDEDRYDWTRFRSFGRLERKLDETLTEYFKAFYAMCKRVTGKRFTEEEENLPISVDPISEERASRCLARIDLLSKIREEILTHPELNERLQLCQHSMDLPDWWVCGKHDKDLLVGAAKYGLNRLDFNLMNDTELSFIEILKQFETNEKKSEINDQKLDNKSESEVVNKDGVQEMTPEIKPEVEKQEEVSEQSVENKEEVKENDDKEVKVSDKELVSKADENNEELTENKILTNDKTPNDVKEEEEVKEDVIESDSKHEENKTIEEETKVTPTPIQKDKSLREILDRKDGWIDRKTEFDLSLSENCDENEKQNILKVNNEVIKKVMTKDSGITDNESEEKDIEDNDNERKANDKNKTNEEIKEEVNESEDLTNKIKSEPIEDLSDKKFITEELLKAVDGIENSEIKTESESTSIATEKEVSTTASSTPQPQTQQKSTLRWPKDRVLQMRLEQICHTIEKNEWPSLRHSFFSLISGPMPSTPSVATADSSPRPLSPCSLSSASREPTPHPTPDHTPRREALSPLPDFFYSGDNSVSLNDSASRRRRRRRRRFEVEAERVKLRNLLTHTIEQQQQQQMPSKKQTSLLSGSTPQFLPPLFSLPFCNLRSAIRDELMTDEKTASLLLGSTLQSSLAAAAASAQSSNSSANSTPNTNTSGSKGPPPAHQNSSARNTPTMGTLDLTGRFKSTPKMTSTPSPAHKPTPKTNESRSSAGQDVLDLSSAAVPTKHSRGSSPAKKSSTSETNPTTNTSSKKSSRKIGSRIDALALNLQAKKMLEEKQIEPKIDKIDSNLSSLEKRQSTYFMDELNKHSALIQNKLGTTPPAAHSRSSNSSKLNDSSLLSSKTNAHFGALDASKLPPSKVNEATSIVEQVAIIRQNLRSLFEDHPEFIAQNPSMASMVAASAANVFNPNVNMNSISSIPANTELLELPDSRRKGRRSRVDPSQLDLQHLTGEENVSVINRTTGKKITGSKAPPLKHLAEWLDKNPKFDVDPKWNPLIKEKAATFKTPTLLSNIGVRTRTSDKRSSSGSSNMSLNPSNLLNNSSVNTSVGSNSTSTTSSSSRRSTAASLLASGYGNAFGNTAVTSSGLNYPSSAALNSLGFNASMLAAGFPSMKMFMDPTSGSTTASSSTTTSASKSTSSSTTPTSSTTTTTSSSGSAPPLFFPFGGLAGMGLANPLFGFPNFLPGLTPNSNSMSGTNFSNDKKESESSSNEKSKSSSKSSGSSNKNKSNLNSSGLLGSSAASALSSGALPFLYPSPNFLYNPLSLSGFSLNSSPFGIPGLMNGLGSLSTTAMSGYTPTNTTNSSTSHSSKTKTTSSRSSKSSHVSPSVSSAPSGLSLASSLLASAGVHPSSAAAAAAIGDSDDDSLKSLMGNDDDDDLNGDFDDKDINHNSDFESETKSATTKKKSSSNKSSSKDLTKSKKSGNSITTSKVSPN